MCLHALVAALVLSGSTADDGFPLELLPANVKAPARTGSRTPPDDCQPPVFDPARPAPGEYGPPMVRRVALAPPFSMVQYEFGCASTWSHVLEVSKGGVRHALYTHVEPDWQLSPDKRTLLVKNVVAGQDGKWEPRFRAIDIATKKAVAFPAHLRCSAYVSGFSGSRMVSTSGVDHQTTPEACAWDSSGLLARMAVNGLEFSGGASDAPANSVELLPAEPTGVYLLVTDSDGGENFDCELVAMDWKNPARRYRRKLGVTLDGMSCHRSEEKVELDLSTFTFEHPTFRYRVVKRQGGGGGRWQTVR